MKNSLILLFIVTILLSCGNTTEKSKVQENKDNESTTFYLVRHAEKDLTVKKDPLLTEDGEKRANYFATYLKDIDAVYSTPYKRTQATAVPTAIANAISIQSYTPNKLWNKTLLEKHKGQTVLIVGHSNTIPQIVNKMTGETSRVDIPDDVYNRIYKVVFENEKAIATMEEIN